MLSRTYPERDSSLLDVSSGEARAFLAAGPMNSISALVELPPNVPILASTKRTPSIEIDSRIRLLALENVSFNLSDRPASCNSGPGASSRRLVELDGGLWGTAWIGSLLAVEDCEVERVIEMPGSAVNVVSGASVGNVNALLAVWVSQRLS